MFIEIPPYDFIHGYTGLHLAHTTHINPNLIVSATNARDHYEKNPEGSIFQMVNNQFFFLPGNHADNLALISNPLYIVPPARTSTHPLLDPNRPKATISQPVLDPKRKKATIQEL